MESTEVRKLMINELSLGFSDPGDETALKVLDNISCEVNDGEFISIVGPSGCGKTTLLNVIAGFVHAQEGSAVYSNEAIVSPSPERAVVFQSAVLFPWLTVHDNIAYGLKRQGIKKRDINRTVKEYLELVKMQRFENYYPAQLSGGMQQRIAIARAIALKPSMLLMDEPFAALDAQTRLTMQELLMDLRQTLATTVILVTHDVEEALYLADRVFIMSKRPGKIVREVKVPFEKNRTLSLRGTNEFVALKTEVLNLVIEQVLQQESSFIGSQTGYLLKDYENL